MYFFFILSLWIVFVEGYLINGNFCEYTCKMRHVDEAIAVERKGNVNLCGLDNIPDNVTVTVMENAEGVSSTGVVRFQLSPPKTECMYKVSLVVNASITNSEDCDKHEFSAQGLNAHEVHTADKSYCFLNNKFDNSNNSKELEVGFCPDTNNPEAKFSIWYENVFSGCYALRFKIGVQSFVFRGKIFMNTDHQRALIDVPRFHCKYSTFSDDKSSFERLIFTTSTSNLVQFKGLHQQITVLSPSDKNRDNACIKYNQNSIFSHKMYTDKVNTTFDNCTISVAGNNQGQNIECNFEVHSSKSSGYCFAIHVLDDRCQKNTGWIVPTNNSPLRCVWVQNCTYVQNNHSLVIQSGNSPEHEHMSTSDFLCLPLIAIILLVLLAVMGSIFCIYRLRLRNSKCNSSTCSIDLKEEVVSKCLEVDEFKYQDELKNEKANVKDIVLLYTKESKAFMRMMTDFRKSLERCVKCHVYDWYAPEEWDNVATIGGYEWVVKLLRKDCRVIWMDTNKARSLFTLQYSLINTKVPNTRVEEFNDFRDRVFPAVVDLAKRSMQHMMLQYSKHYVVRIEGFETFDEASDPFADLSPHVRYIIPHHLQELCSHLSMQISMPEEVQLEETLLRQHLVINEEHQDLSLYKIC